MSGLKQWARWCSGGMLCMLFALGCESIAGIEKRTLGEDPACAAYCDDLEQSCVGDQAVYAQRSVCMKVCAQLDPGDPTEPTKGTLACRANKARDIREPEADCPLAGPGGGALCGDDCASYCELFKKICPDEFGNQTQAHCEEQCGALVRADSFSANQNSTGDTLDCRLVHLSAATENPALHCPHVAVVPLDANQPCTNPADEAPTCEEYCRLTFAACPDERGTWDNLQQCEDTCPLLEIGKNRDTGARLAAFPDDPRNTIGCRKYHAYSAFKDPVTHCSHTGPTADAHCGAIPSVCESYCVLLQNACESGFNDAFGDDLEACEEDCSGVPGHEGDVVYSVELADSEEARGTLTCRIAHTVRALKDPDAECEAAFGGGACAED